MGVSGWVLYLLVTHVTILVLAIFLSLLAIPRFVRGSWQKADERVTYKLNQPVAPSKRVAHILLPEEKLLVETQDHPIRLLWWGLAGLALSLLMGLFVFKVDWTIDGHHLNVIIGVTLWVVGMLAILAKTALWQRDKLCLTDKRVFVVRGLLKVRHEFMPLQKLTNEKLQIPWHSNILTWLRLINTQYGTLVVDAAGDEDELKNIRFIPNAIQINRIIMERALG